MNYLIVHFPAWLLCLVFTSLVIFVSGLLLSLFRRYFDVHSLDGIRESAGIIFGAIGLIYSLLLAFVIISVWEDYEEVNNNVKSEAAKLLDIYRWSKELPPAAAQALKLEIAAYAAAEVKTEWNNTSESPIFYEVGIGANEINKLDSFNFNKTIVDRIKSDINDVVELQNERIGGSGSHVPFLVWFILIAGSFVMIMITYVFIMPARLHYLFSSLLTGMIAMCMFLLFMIDRPLCGTSAVSPQPLLELTRLP